LLPNDQRLIVGKNLVQKKYLNEKLGIKKNKAASRCWFAEVLKGKKLYR
jgi:hypothetical protein